MNSPATFINATEQATFTSRGFRNGARVVSLLGGPAGTIVDASSPDLVIHWEDRDSGIRSSAHYISCKVLA